WRPVTTSGSTASLASASRSWPSRSSTGPPQAACSPLTEPDPPPTDGMRPIRRGHWYGPNVQRAAALKQGYTSVARNAASRSITGLARTRVTPNALTASGVLLCAAASVLVLLESRHELLFYWLGAVVFVAGSVLDILDGALARAGGKTTPFGAFLDSTTDRISEGFMLTAIAYVFARHGRDVFVAVTMAAVAGSFLVSYTRARAERPRPQRGQGPRRDHRHRQLRQLAPAGPGVLQGRGGRPLRPRPDARESRRLPHPRHRSGRSFRRRQGQGRRGHRRRDVGAPEQ